MSVTPEELARAAEAIRLAEPPEEHDCDYTDPNLCTFDNECRGFREQLRDAQAEAVAVILRPEGSELICHTCRTAWSYPHTVTFCALFQRQETP